MRARGLAAALKAPVGFAVAVAVLLLAGRGDLAAPPIDGFGEWLEARGPLTATMAIARLVALAAAVWMLVVATVAAVAGAVGATRLVMAAERAVPPGLRRTLTGLAGAGAAGAALVGVGRAPIDALADRRDAAAQPPEAGAATTATTAPAMVATDDTVTMSFLPPDAPGPGVGPGPGPGVGPGPGPGVGPGVGPASSGSGAAADGSAAPGRTGGPTPTTGAGGAIDASEDAGRGGGGPGAGGAGRPGPALDPGAVGGDGSAGDGGAESGGTGGPTPTTGAGGAIDASENAGRAGGGQPTDGSGGDVVETWTVEPGDSFWSIAEELLADAGSSGHPPSDAEIVPYWRALIEANRDGLVVADEPDFIVPGQQLVVPQPPP